MKLKNKKKIISKNKIKASGKKSWIKQQKCLYKNSLKEEFKFTEGAYLDEINI